MKANLEIPYFFWLKDSGPFHEFKAFYHNLMASLLAEGCELSVARFENLTDESIKQDTRNGITFAYHTRQPGKNTYCVKSAPISGLWHIDSSGYSGWSEIANDAALQRAGLDFPIEQALSRIAHYRTRFVTENFSKYPQNANALEAPVASLPKFVFYPLQVNNDEVLKLAKFTQVEVIRKLVELAEATKIHVVIKRHPYCQSEHIEREICNATKSKFVTASQSSVHMIISRCQSVVVANSGVGLEALIHGKPVYSFAASEYAHMTKRLSSIDEIIQSFTAQPAIQPETITRQLGFLLIEYFVDGDDASSVATRVKKILETYKNSGEADIAADQIKEANAGLSSTRFAIEKLLYDSVDYMLSVYDQMPDETKARMSPLLVRAATRSREPEKMLVRFDEKNLLKFNMQCFNEKKIELAETYARLSLEKFQTASARYMLAKVLMAKGDKAGGMALAEAAAAASDAPAEALVFIGHKRFTGKSAQADLALEYARKAQALQPEYARAYWLEAQALSHLSQNESALHAANRAVELAPTNIVFREFLASLLPRVAEQKTGPAPVQHKGKPSIDPSNEFADYDLVVNKYLKANPGKKFTDFSLSRVVSGLERGSAHDTLGDQLTNGQSWKDAGYSTFEDLFAWGKLSKESRVIDYGCGSLRVTQHFIRHQEPSTVMALDAVWNFIDIGKSLLEPSVIEDKRPRFGLIDTAMTEAELFQADFVFASSVARHIHPDEKREFFDNLIRLTGKQGCVLAFNAHISAKPMRFARSGWSWPLEFYLEGLAPLKFNSAHLEHTAMKGRGIERKFLLFSRT